MADRASNISPYRLTSQRQDSPQEQSTFPIPALSAGTRATSGVSSRDSDSPSVTPIESPEGSPFQVFVNGPGTGANPLLRAGTGWGRFDSLLSQTSSEDCFSNFSPFSSFGSEAMDGGSHANVPHSALSTATASFGSQGPGSLLRLDSYQREGGGEGQEPPTVVISNWNILLVTVRARPALNTSNIEAALTAVRTALDAQEPDVGRLDELFDRLHLVIAEQSPVQEDPQLLRALSQLKGAIATMPDELPWMYRKSLRN